MSFRTRLTSFFVLIVVVPMIAIGAMVFRLISQSEQGKADAGASSAAAVAASVYASEAAAGTRDAATIGRAIATLHGAALHRALASLTRSAGLQRVLVTSGRTVVADVGSPDAIAPGFANVTAGGRRLSVAASELSAAAYAHELASRGTGVVVRSGTHTLSATLSVGTAPLPRLGAVSVGGAQYRAVTQTRRGFHGRVAVTVLSSLASQSVAGSQALAAAFIAGFLLLAFLFSVLASRALQGQIRRFLQAARRLGQGDFSSEVPVDGRDDFAALGTEFNQMSRQLKQRIEDLARERERLQASIHRIGETFAANLDRQGLLDLALHTAIDAVQADAGRVTVRSHPEQRLEQCVRSGKIAGLEEGLLTAERAALGSEEAGRFASRDHAVATVRLGTFAEGIPRGLITVARHGNPFSDAELDVLRSLAAQAGFALENVDLHFQVQRQAVTDELTGLANHRQFQELLSHEVEQVRRYHHPIAVIMFDIDNFKKINDTYGHPQGDLVLKQVARVLRENSREVDVPARYGGEEMALILPHTDLEGGYVIAERVRTSIEALEVPRLDGVGELRVTVSVGIASSSDGEKDALVADADAALYVAKRGGKNQTVRAQPRTANVLVGE